VEQFPVFAKWLAWKWDEKKRPASKIRRSPVSKSADEELPVNIPQ